MVKIFEEIAGVKLPEVPFGKKIFSDTEGDRAALLSLADVKVAEFSAYAKSLKKEGFTKFDYHRIADNEFYTYQKGNDAVYLSYYPNIEEMRIVAEAESLYLNFSDTPREEKYKTLVTQLALFDYGLSYVIRLSDGRFIVLDGGYEHDKDTDNLYNVMKEQSPFEKPVIAAWFMTHPHIDHYRCYLPFMEKFENKVVVERMLYNFPEFREDVEKRLPQLVKWNDVPYMERMDRHARKTTKVYKPHTGQIYDFANAHIEMLSTPDDTLCPEMQDVNPLSLVFKMTIDGQVILFTADVYTDESKLAERYGSYLKCDILQIPHHGFDGGCNESESVKKVYKLADPETCLFCGFDDFHWHSFHYNDYGKYILTELNVEKVFFGGENETFELPYHPGKACREVLLDRIAQQRKALGAKSWYFVGYSIDECKFTIVNRGHTKKILVYMFFEDDKMGRIHVRPKLLGDITKIDFSNPGHFEDSERFEKIYSEIKPDYRITLHFQVDEPVVIVGPKPADYMY